MRGGIQFVRRTYAEHGTRCHPPDRSIVRYCKQCMHRGLTTRHLETGALQRRRVLVTRESPRTADRRTRRDLAVRGATS